MGSGLGQLRDRFEIEIALLEAEAGGAIDPEFDGDFVTGPDPSGLALGDLPSTAAVLNGEVVADGASEGLSEERVEIAPAVAHARHMPTHIFIQHGMWDRVSGNNEYAYTAARELWRPDDPMGNAVHPLDWGQYGDLQLGDYAKARKWIDRLESMAFEGVFLEGGPRGAPGQARAVNTVPLLKARYIVETEEWEVRPITDESSMHELLATGMSAARTGDQATVAQAEAALKEMADRGPNGNTNARIISKQVGALLHAGMGHGAVATGLMDEARAIVEEGAAPRGAASPVKPVHELYGEILLDLDRTADAIEKFETSLLRMPNRPRSLLGLARAYAKTGNREMAAEAYEKLTNVWAGRESFAGFQEARRFLETTDAQ